MDVILHRVDSLDRRCITFLSGGKQSFITQVKPPVVEAALFVWLVKVRKKCKVGTCEVVKWMTKPRF